MTRREEKAVRLQEWILVEAYKSGLARREGVGGLSGSGPDGSGPYSVDRHDIYERYFGLRAEASVHGAGNIGAFRRHVRLRLRCTAILCESVKRLVRDRLIHFPLPASVKRDDGDPLRGYATPLCLTPMGVSRAQALISPAPDPGGRCGPDSAWTILPGLKPGGSVSLPAS